MNHSRGGWGVPFPGRGPVAQVQVDYSGGILVQKGHSLAGYAIALHKNHLRADLFAIYSPTNKQIVQLPFDAQLKPGSTIIHIPSRPQAKTDIARPQAATNADSLAILRGHCKQRGLPASVMPVVEKASNILGTVNTAAGYTRTALMLAELPLQLNIGATFSAPHAILPFSATVGGFTGLMSSAWIVTQCLTPFITLAGCALTISGLHDLSYRTTYFCGFAYGVTAWTFDRPEPLTLPPSLAKKIGTVNPEALKEHQNQWYLGVTAATNGKAEQIARKSGYTPQIYKALMKAGYGMQYYKFCDMAMSAMYQSMKDNKLKSNFRSRHHHGVLYPN